MKISDKDFIILLQDCFLDVSDFVQGSLLYQSSETLKYVTLSEFSAITITAKTIQSILEFMFKFLIKSMAMPSCILITNSMSFALQQFKILFSQSYKLQILSPKAFIFAEPRMLEVRKRSFFQLLVKGKKIFSKVLYFTENY